MLQVMKDIGGIEIPETLAKLASAEKKEAGQEESAQPTVTAGPPPQPRS
jgi:hypothetical protein